VQSLKERLRKQKTSATVASQEQVGRFCAVDSLGLVVQDNFDVNG